MSKILLLVGTGAMGVSLGRRLSERGDNVFVTTRRERPDAGGVKFVHGNAKEINFLQETLQNIKPDTVVDFMSYGSAEFAARKELVLNGTGQYVFMSSCRVFAGENVHTERSPRLLDVCKDAEYLKTDEYALAKARSEDALQDSRLQNWTIVRPCITYAYPRLQFGCLEANTFLPRVLQGLSVPIPKEMLQKRTTMLHGDVVAEMIARLIGNQKAMGEDFNAVTSESHTWAEVAGLYGEFLGMKIVPCSMDVYVSFCNPWQVKFGRMVHHVFDNRKILDVTGMRPGDIVPLREGLLRETKGALTTFESVNADLWRIAKIDCVLKTRFRVCGGWRAQMRYERFKHPAFDFVCRCGARALRSVL